jgi:hypothetical protein
VAANVPNAPKIYQHFPFQDPLKYTKICVFGICTNTPSGNPANLSGKDLFAFKGGVKIYNRVFC